MEKNTKHKIVSEIITVFIISLFKKVLGVIRKLPVYIKMYVEFRHMHHFIHSIISSIRPNPRTETSLQRLEH